MKITPAILMVEAGTPPFLPDKFFPKRFLMVIDESHVTVPQIKAMFGGDAARKRESR